MKWVLLSNSFKVSRGVSAFRIKCARDPPPSARGSAGRRVRAGCSPAESCQIFSRRLKYFCYGWDLFVIRILSTSSCSPSSRSAHIHSNLRRRETLNLSIRYLSAEVCNAMQRMLRYLRHKSHYNGCGYFKLLIT